MCGTYQGQCDSTEFVSRFLEGSSSIGNKNDVRFDGVSQQVPSAFFMISEMFVGSECIESMSMMKMNMKTDVQRQEGSILHVFVNDVSVIMQEMFISQLTCESAVEAGKEYSVKDLQCVDSIGEDPFKYVASTIGTAQELPVEFTESNVTIGDESMARIYSEGCSAAPTTVAPTTVAPTTVAPTTVAPTTVAPTTAAPTTVAPTTVAPTTVAPTTVAPTTVTPTTVAPTTVAPTTVAPTTVAPTTVAPTTEAPTTAAPTTEAPTVIPTTVAPTEIPTTIAPTVAPTTVAPTPEPEPNNSNIIMWIIIGVVVVIIIAVLLWISCRPKRKELETVPLV